MTDGSRKKSDPNRLSALSTNAANAANANAPIPTSHQASPRSEAHATPQAPAPAPAPSLGRSSSTATSDNLLFLNYSDPSEFKSKSNKRIVKRWASTSGHRTGSHSSGWDPALRRIEPSSQDADRDRTSSTIATGVPHAEVKDSITTASDPLSRSLASTQPGYEIFSSSSFSKSSSDAASTSDSSGSRIDTGRWKKPSLRRNQRTSSKSSKSSSDEPRALRKILPASASSADPYRSPTIENVARDPFDVLPVKVDSHGHELLSLYLNVQLLSPAWTQVEDNATEFQSSLAAYRKSFWFPILRDSQAAFAALMAYVECTPGLVSSSITKRGFLEHYQSLALRTANSELADSKTATSDSTLLAVVLLMIGAQRSNDLTVFRIHARGLSLILKQRRDDRRRGKRQLLDFEHCFDSSATARATRTKIGRRTDPYNPMSPLLRAEQTPDMPNDFYSLYRRGLISAHVGYFHAFTVTLVALGLESADDQLAASSTVHHIFIEGIQPLPPTNSLENACLLTMRLILHCFVRPVRDPDDKLTLYCIFGIAHALMDYGIEVLLAKAPQAVAWMAFAAASQAKGAAGSSIRISFDAALRNALLLSHMSDFEQTLQYLEEHFLWVPTIYQDALELWTVELGLPGPVIEEASVVEIA